MAQLLPLLRFVQAVTHHASKPAEPELPPPTPEDLGLDLPTEADASAANAGSVSESTAGVSASEATGPASGAVLADAGAAEAAAGAGPGADGADLAPVAVPGAVQGADEGSEESEAEDMDEEEDEEEDMNEEIDNEGSSAAFDGPENKWLIAYTLLLIQVRMIPLCNQVHDVIAVGADTPHVRVLLTSRSRTLINLLSMSGMTMLLHG